MNKTVTINISGIIFHIEEDAYEKLSKYLNTIKGYFSNTDGGNEIMSDIEARIAEMLQGKVSAVKQVVLMADVDTVIETMGKPEEFADGTEQKAEEKTTDHTFYQEPVKKRLFRDPDHKAVGGVCSGIAAYFDVDMIWIRLVMFLLIFFGGLSLWIYIILWIVIPEAKTVAEKLAMRGEKVDINNISRSVKEEAEALKKRMEKYGNDLKNNTGEFRESSRNFFDKVGDFIKDFFILFGKVFARLVGLALVIFGVMFLISFITGLFGISVMGSNADFKEWIDLIFMDRSHYTLGIFGSILFLGVPILMILYGGIKLLFRIHYTNRWFNLSAGIIWLIGLVIVLFVVIRTVGDFSEEGRVKDQVQIQSTRDTLYLTVSSQRKTISELALNEEEFEDYDHRGRHRITHNRNRDYVLTKVGNTKVIAGYATLSIIESGTDKFALYVIKNSQGEDKRTAMNAAKAIQYRVMQNDSVITFDDIFTVPAIQRFRWQDVEIVLEIPKGKVVRLDKSLSHFMSNVENVTNTFDGDMVGRRWKMTDLGLECVDCDGIEDLRGGHPAPPAPPVNPGNIHVDSKDANIKIDKDGIKIESKDTDVNIDKDGIHVKEKKGK